jgi:hypothetical protein
MQIQCQRCKKVFDSLIIDKNMAWNECFTKLQSHVSRKHEEAIAQIQVELAKTMTSVAAYVTITNLAYVGPDEKYIHELLFEYQRDFLLAAGFTHKELAEMEGEEGEEDEDDDLVTEESTPDLPEDVPNKEGPDDNGVILDKSHKEVA